MFEIVSVCTVLPSMSLRITLDRRSCADAAKLINNKQRDKNNLFIVFNYIAATKLLQKSEMRKDIVIELSYKGFSCASDYS